GGEPQTYNFDSSQVAAFRKLAADNKYGLAETLRVGNKLRSVTTIEGFKKAVGDVKFKKCRIIWKGVTYDLESDGKGSVKIDRVQSQMVQTTGEIHQAVLRLRQARVRYYVMTAQNVVYGLLQAAGAAFVLNRIFRRAENPFSRMIKVEGEDDDPHAAPPVPTTPKVEIVQADIEEE
nr:p22 [Norovirus GIV]